MGDHIKGGMVVVCKASGDAVLETVSWRVAERINRDAYDVIPSRDYLERLNTKIKAGSK